MLNLYKANNKEKIKFDCIISTKKYKFKLIIGLSGSDEDFNNKIMSNNKDIFNIIENKFLTEIKYNMNSLILYPCILFYEKINENKENSSSILNMNFSNGSSSKGNNIDKNINNINNINNVYDYNYNYFDDKIINNKKFNNNYNIKINDNLVDNQYIKNKEIKEYLLNYNNFDNNKNEDEQITLFFYFSNNKKLYIDVDTNLSFKQVVEELHSKYLWLKNIEIISFLFEGKKISFDKTVKEIGLKDNSIILIKEG